MSGVLVGLPANMIKLRKLGVIPVFNMTMLINQIQEQLNELQSRLEAMTFQGTACQGKIRAWANGLQLIVGLDISPELEQKLSLAELRDGIVVACNAALQQARDRLSDEIGRLSGGSLAWRDPTDGRY